MERILVEDCRFVSITDIKAQLKGIQSGLSVVEGLININRHFQTKPLELKYWIEQKADDLSIFLILPGRIPQRVELSPRYLTYGTGYYFLCPYCGDQLSKLYLPSLDGSFKCRKCHHLTYQLTTINKHSKFGKFSYIVALLNKQDNDSGKGSRLFYGNDFTKSFYRRIELHKKLGFTAPKVEEIKEVMRLVNSDRQ